MFDSHIFNDFAKEFTSHLPPAFQDVKADFEKQLKHFMQRCFNELDLVTREEFDAQALLLANTKSQLAELEARLSALEKELVREG